MKVALLAAVLLAAAPATAQVPVRTPPGPFVVDVRGSTSGLPTDPAVYPPVGSTVAVPGRGFGLDVGAHVYLFSLGASRVGVGGAFVTIEGDSTDATATLRLIAPQISLNFGSGNGWSYLSAGIGTARIDTDVGGNPGGRVQTGSLRSVNAGGGARWFLSDHVGVGFDVRFHRVASGQIAPSTVTPDLTLVTASIGISLK